MCNGPLLAHFFAAVSDFSIRPEVLFLNTQFNRNGGRYESFNDFVCEI